MQIHPARRKAFWKNSLQSVSGGGTIPGFGLTNRGADFAIRRQVDLDRLLFIPVRGDLQDGRATQPAVRDQHFFPERLMAGGSNDFRGESRQIAIFRAVFGSQNEWNERWFGWPDFQTE